MAANLSKDQPLGYSIQNDQASTAGDSAEPSTIPTLKHNHSTRASELLRAPSGGTLTTSQYLELTFSVMVDCNGNGNVHPVVLAIDENCETLLDDTNKMFVNPKWKIRMTEMKAVWGRAGAHEWMEVQRCRSTIMTIGNITATLRLMKSRNGLDYLRVGI